MAIQEPTETRKKKNDNTPELDFSKICASTGVSFTGQITAFTVAERMQHFELAVRTALEAVQFLPKPSDALARGQLACSPPCNDRLELVERLGTAHRILAQRLRNLGARPLPSVRLNRKEQAQHLQQWIAARLEKDRIASVHELFDEYFEQNQNVIHQCYALSRHAFWQHFGEVVQSYWHTSTDSRGRLTVYYNDPSQPKLSVKRRGADGWKAQAVGILKPCRSRDFLHHSRGYERQAVNGTFGAPPSPIQNPSQSIEMEKKGFFVPLKSKDALPTRGPDLDFMQTSPPSARRRIHSGIPLSYRTPRAIELVRTAWNRALESTHTPLDQSLQETTAPWEAIADNNILPDLLDKGSLPEIEAGPSDATASIASFGTGSSKSRPISRPPPVTTR